MSPPPPGPSAAVRVLVVDDEPAVIDAYRQVLDASPASADRAALDALRTRLFLSGGSPALLAKQPPRPKPFDATYCSGAHAAVAAVREANAANQPFAVAFLDMRMPPGPDGVWTAQKIREIDPQVEIVVCTAYSDVDPLEIGRRVPPADKLFYLQKPFHPHEIRQMAAALGEKRANTDRRLSELSDADDLTGLPTRAKFLARLREAVDDARGRGRSMALFYLDIDNFRRINDALGHTVGDEMLRRVAVRLREALQRDDVSNCIARRGAGPDVARLGGDQFVVLVDALREPADAALIAQHLAGPMLASNDADQTQVTLTASVGIAIYPTDSEDDEALLRQSGIAMYAAKRQGRGNFAYFNATMKDGAQARFGLESRLQGALERGELSLHYQPQFDLGTGRVSGIEALLRWTNPELGRVPPEEFIPMAEETGLIVPLGEWAMRTACEQFRRWLDMDLEPGRIAVNVSPAQFAHPGFCSMVTEVLRDTGIEPRNLEIEITESLAMRDDDRTRDIIAELRATGVSIAIDDFGMGHSNLSRLSTIAVNRLKIDRTLVHAVDSVGRRSTIVGAIVSMARALGLQVVAEGVEDFEQLLNLQEQQCNEVQGFLLSKALPVDEATQLLQRLEASTATSRTMRLRSLAI